MSKTYNIDRQTASRLLNVSLRTIDRYLAADKVSSIKNNGRVWLAKSDILRLAQQNQHVENDLYDDMTRLHRHVDNLADTDNDNVYSEHEEIYEHSPSKSDNTYKRLYEEVKEELAEKQQRLDQASYRVGQLEAQVQSMVPLVDFQRQQKVLAETTDKYSEALREEEEKRRELAENLMSEIKTHKELVKTKEDELEIERLNKAIFAVILFIILALQPILWLLLR